MTIYAKLPSSNPDEDTWITTCFVSAESFLGAYFLEILSFSIYASLSKSQGGTPL